MLRDGAEALLRKFLELAQGARPLQRWIEALADPADQDRWQPGAAARGERFLEVYLDLTDQCNLRCVMCHIPHADGKATQQLGRDTYEQLAAALFPHTANAVLSCLHEPLMVRGFFDYVARVVDFGVPEITITTNAQLMRPRMCRKILASGLTDIHVSVDGASAAVYESIRRGASFDTLLENLETFAAMRGESALPRLQIQAVIMPENSDELPLFVERFARFRPRRMLFIHQDLQPPARRDAVERQLRRALAACVEAGIIFEEYPDLCIPPRQVLAAYGLDGVRRETESGCTDPFRFIRIQPDGDVFFCSGASQPAGNLLRSSITEIWNAHAARRLRQAWRGATPPPQCARCSLPLLGTTRLMQRRRRVDASLDPIIARPAPVPTWPSS